MNMSAEIGELSTALTAVQAEVKNVVADQKSYYGKYANLEQVLNMARPIWTKHGLAISQFPVSEMQISTHDGTPMAFAGIETIVSHTSGQWLSERIVMHVQPELTDEGKEALSLGQVAGKIISYARRYSMNGILNIAQEDDDASTAGQRGGSSNGRTVRKPDDPATDKQRAWVEKIANRKDLTDEQRSRLKAKLAGTLSKGDASEIIDHFQAKDKAAKEAADADPVDETPEGTATAEPGDEEPKSFDADDDLPF